MNLKESIDACMTAQKDMYFEELNLRRKAESKLKEAVELLKENQYASYECDKYCQGCGEHYPEGWVHALDCHLNNFIKENQGE